MIDELRDARNRPPAVSKKESWQPFPDCWPTEGYQLFKDYLEKDPDAERIRTYFMPRCDFFKVYAFAVAHAKYSQCVLHDRQTRMERDLADLRNEERRVEAAIKALGPTSWTPEDDEPLSIETFHRSAYYRKLCENAALQERIARLGQIKRHLETVRRVGNIRRYGLREDLSWLFIIREYLEWKSGRIVIHAKDLSVIVAAAYHALRTKPPDDQVSAIDINRRLRRFQRNCPEFCMLARLETRNIPPDNN